MMFVVEVFNKKRIFLILKCGLLSTIVFGFFLLYSNHVTNPSAGNIVNASLGDGWWYGYLKAKFGLFQVFNMEYLKIVLKRFKLHFTEFGWVIIIFWVCITCGQQLFGKKKGKQDWFLPLLLLSPAILYIALVPHNTEGHLWTLYWVWPFMASIFGLTMNKFYLLCKYQWQRIAVSCVMIITLMIYSLPIINKLHSISTYHVSNVRAGQLINLFSTKSTKIIGDNYDTIAFYANSPFDEVPRKLMSNYLEDGNKPAFITFNQIGFYTLSKKSKLMEYLKDFDEKFKSNGYHLWLSSPFPIWTNIDTSSINLLLDSHNNNIENNRNKKTIGIKECILVNQNKLLRGFYHLSNSPTRHITKWKHVKIDEEQYRLCLSLMRVRKGRSSSSANVRYKIDIEHDKGTTTIEQGNIEKSYTPSQKEINISIFLDQKINIIFSTSFDNINGEELLIWAEQRIVKKEYIDNSQFELKDDTDIYLDIKRFSRYKKNSLF
jgi:hypothetical protein